MALSCNPILLSRKKKVRPPPPADLPPEEKAAEAVTVGWMLCALFTFCAELVGLVAQLALTYVGELEEGEAHWALLPPITLGIGLVSGVLTLALTPIVYRLRKTPPPEAITVVAVLVGLAPPATLLVQWLRG